MNSVSALLVFSMRIRLEDWRVRELCPLFGSDDMPFKERGLDRGEGAILIQRYLPLLSKALISSWLPKNETKRSAGRTWNIKRNAKLPRHSKSLFPNLRMASPLWMWGWPKISVSSHNASRHSAFSVSGSSRSRCITAGSMVRALANHLPQLFGGDGNQFCRALELPVAPVRGLFQS